MCETMQRVQRALESRRAEADSRQQRRWSAPGQRTATAVSDDGSALGDGAGRPLVSEFAPLFSPTACNNYMENEPPGSVVDKSSVRFPQRIREVVKTSIASSPTVASPSVSTAATVRRASSPLTQLDDRLARLSPYNSCRGTPTSASSRLRVGPLAASPSKRTSGSK